MVSDQQQQLKINFLTNDNWGKTTAEIDKKTLKRLQDIQKLPQEERDMVFKVIDSLLRDYKTKQVHAA